VIVPCRRMFLMKLPVRRSVGAVPFSVFFGIGESFLMSVAMLRVELLVKALVLRVIEKVAQEVLDGV
jgi:hypothetical protein